MNNRFGSYLLFSATAFYFFLLILLLSILNSSLSRFGLYLFLPCLFLATPSGLSKNLSRSLVIFNGLLLDYHNNLPLGFSIFLLLSIYLAIEGKFKFQNLSRGIEGRIIMILINTMFFIGVYIVSHVESASLNQPNFSKFITDSLISTMIVFWGAIPHYALINQLASKIISIQKEKSVLTK